jgi:hypothetical protein
VPASSINPFRVLLTHRNFRLFWIGQTLSLIGTWMQTMAQGWLALELTNNPFLVGLVASLGSLPILVFRCRRRSRIVSTSFVSLRSRSRCCCSRRSPCGG